MRLNDLMTVEEGAATLGCSVATIWRRIKSGDLSTRKRWSRTFLLRSEVESLARDGDDANVVLAGSGGQR